MTYIMPKIRASTRQRRAVAEYATNGGDKIAAYRTVYGSDASRAQWTIKQFSSAANSLFKQATMKTLMAELNIEARLKMEVKAAQGIQTAIEKYGITKDRIMSELAKIAFAQQTDVMSWGPNGVVVKSSDELGDAASAVGEVIQSGGGDDSPVVMKIKLLDKRQALIDLGREIGMFQQQVQHKGQVAVAVGAKFIVEGK